MFASISISPHLDSRVSLSKYIAFIYFHDFKPDRFVWNFKMATHEVLNPPHESPLGWGIRRELCNTSQGGLLPQLLITTARQLSFLVPEKEACWSDSPSRNVALLMAGNSILGFQKAEGVAWHLCAPPKFLQFESQITQSVLVRDSLMQASLRGEITAGQNPKGPWKTGKKIWKWVLIGWRQNKTFRRKSAQSKKWKMAVF